MQAVAPQLGNTSSSSITNSFILSNQLKNGSYFFHITSKALESGEYKSAWIEIQITGISASIQSNLSKAKFEQNEPISVNTDITNSNFKIDNARLNLSII